MSSTVAAVGTATAINAAGYTAIPLALTVPVVTSEIPRVFRLDSLDLGATGSAVGQQITVYLSYDSAGRRPITPATSAATQVITIPDGGAIGGCAWVYDRAVVLPESDSLYVQAKTDANTATVTPRAVLVLG